MMQNHQETIELARMRAGTCPECGDPETNHLASNSFWLGRRCDLTREGVIDRLAAFQAQEAGEPTEVMEHASH